MSRAILTIDLNKVAQNWRTLDQMTAASVQTAAVVKADGYGMGAVKIATALQGAGVTQFFVALASEGVELRRALGPAPVINIFSGHMDGDSDLIRANTLTPMLNSPEQLSRHLEMGDGHPYGIQLDTGMGRLGMQPSDWVTLNHASLRPSLVMSHLACADEPDHPMNTRQLKNFRDLTDGFGYPRSLSATAGILLGPAYHFDLTRPGIGIFGGEPFNEAAPVVHLALPVIQIRDLKPGDTVGYSNTWTASHASRIATVGAGYADGLLRSLSGSGRLFAGDTPCPIVGRVSMDLICADVTGVTSPPKNLDMICPHQSIDQLAAQAGTIGHEILTSLGARYHRRYTDDV